MFTKFVVASYRLCESVVSGENRESRSKMDADVDAARMSPAVILPHFVVEVLSKTK